MLNQGPADSRCSSSPLPPFPPPPPLPPLPLCHSPPSFPLSIFFPSSPNPPLPPHSWSLGPVLTGKKYSFPLNAKLCPLGCLNFDTAQCASEAKPLCALPGTLHLCCTMETGLHHHRGLTSAHSAYHRAACCLSRTCPLAGLRGA